MGVCVTSCLSEVFKNICIIAYAFLKLESRSSSECLSVEYFDKGPVARWISRQSYKDVFTRARVEILNTLTRHGLSVCIPKVLVLCFATSSAIAEPSVLARRNDLTAYLVSCEQGTAHIEVTAPSGNAYMDELGDFGTMLRSLRFILPTACENLDKVTVTGKAGEEVWYAGATEPSEDWEFTSLFAPPNH